jgi:SAM-dependent methyltransferase
MDIMYGETDHAYLKQMREDERIDHSKSAGKYTHAWFQQKYLSEDITRFNLKGKRFLDYACGSGFLLFTAIERGMQGIGVEYNQKFAATMSAKTGLTIIGKEQFEQNEQVFDVIHLGHILEHLPDPKAFIVSLKRFAHADTLFIIDGPLELNACLAHTVIRIGSRLKRKKLNAYPPQHLTFTQVRSQRYFLETICGFSTQRFQIAEQSFPFPNKIVNSASSILGYCLGRVSITFSSMHPTMGNIFHFVGKMKSIK